MPDRLDAKALQVGKPCLTHPVFELGQDSPRGVQPNEVGAAYLYGRRAGQDVLRGVFAGEYAANADYGHVYCLGNLVDKG